MHRWATDSISLKGKQKVRSYPFQPGDIVLVHDRRGKWYAEVVDVFSSDLVAVSQVPGPMRKRAPSREAFAWVETTKLRRVWPPMRS